MLHSIIPTDGAMQGRGSQSANCLPACLLYSSLPDSHSKAQKRRLTESHHGMYIQDGQGPPHTLLATPTTGYGDRHDSAKCHQGTNGSSLAGQSQDAHNAISRPPASYPIVSSQPSLPPSQPTHLRSSSSSQIPPIPHRCNKWCLVIVIVIVTRENSPELPAACLTLTKPLSQS